MFFIVAPFLHTPSRNTCKNKTETTPRFDVDSPFTAFRSSRVLGQWSFQKVQRVVAKDIWPRCGDRLGGGHEGLGFFFRLTMMEYIND